MSQFDLMDILKIPYTERAEYMFLARAHGTLNHTRGHKTNHEKFKRIEIIKTVFSDRNKITLHINTNISENLTLNIWKLKHTFLN